MCTSAGLFQSRRHRNPLRQVKTPLAQFVKLGALPDVPDDLEDITNTGEHLALAEKESDYHAWVYPLIATARLLPFMWTGALIVDYAEKDRNGTRAALADNKQTCKSYEALGSTDQSDRWDPLPGRPRQAKTRPPRHANAERVGFVTVGPEPKPAE